jgi:hypothetical protein
MNMRQVEVDEEVFQFVKAHAEPLVDTFNSALRRLLPLTEYNAQSRVFQKEVVSPKPTSILPSFASRTPQALKQALEVIHLVRGGAYTRVAATHYLARHHNVRKQTVYDKYCRQLNLTAEEFDRLLEQTDLSDLRKILKSKFPSYAQIIDEVLK